MSLKFILTNSLITLSLYSNDIIPRYEPYISPLSKNISRDLPLTRISQSVSTLFIDEKFDIKMLLAS